MGAIRTYTKRHAWTDEEVGFLRGAYADAPWPEMEARLSLPRRTIMCKANGLGLARRRTEPRTPDQVREAKRRHMAEKRATDAEAARTYQRAWRKRNADRVNAQLREAVGRRLFWGRALRLRGVNAFDLWRLWKKQRGLCALSGRRLDRTAEIDHRMPKVRGGDDRLSNLQWVTKEANRAKRDLTEAEFLLLCRNCVEWIAERIDAVDNMEAVA